MFRPLQHIRELDGLRGIAALSVLAHHVFFTSVNYELWPRPERWLGELSHLGMYGVDLFFVLSGYLITSLLLERREMPLFYHDFYWKRIFRILPIYFILLATLTLTGGVSVRYAVICAIFLANFASVFHIASDGPFWTLAIEEQFYVVWPQVIRRLSITPIRRVAFGIVIGTLLLRIGAASVGHTNYRFTFFHCDGLAFGAILACECQVGRLNPVNAKYELPFFRFVLLLGLAAIGLSRIMVGTSLRGYYDAVVLTLFGVFFFGLIGGVVKHAASDVLRLLRLPPLVFVGSISYCLYMVHIYVLRYVDSQLGAIMPGDVGRYWVRVLDIVGFSILIAAVSRYLIEQPVQTLRRFVMSSKAVRYAGVSAKVGAGNSD